MLILLPPSESKRPGGRTRSALDLTALRFADLAEQRRVTADALVALSRHGDREAAARSLGVPRTRVAELDTNSALFSSPLLPAIDRYTGVLYDALGAGSLPAEARRHLGRTTAIHSAVFGPVGALDGIPDYRMSATSRLPGVKLRALWSAATADVLATVPGPIIDLRSETYAALGPVTRGDSVYVRVVAEGPDGVQRALNHFNKHAKGELVRRFVLDRPRIRSVHGFVDWARSAGFRLEHSGVGEALLVTG